MTPVTRSNFIELKVAIVEPTSRKIFARMEHGRPRLPRLTILQRSRLARAVQVGIEEQIGVHTVVVDFIPFQSDVPSIVAAEANMNQAQAGLCTTPLIDFSASEIPDPDRHDLEAILYDRNEHLVSRIGWVQKATRWFEQVIGTKAYPKESIKQHNAGRGFALLQFTLRDHREFWIKATSRSNSHERALTHALSQLSPSSLPDFLAEEPEWNAWLMSGSPVDVGTSSGALGADLGTAVHTLAKLQRNTVGQDTSLLEVGAFDQRLSTLRTDAGALFEYISSAMTHQVSTKVDRIHDNRLCEIKQTFVDGCDILQSTGVPHTIVHGDMNQGNLLLSGGGCRLIDWSEGCVGLPFATLQHLLLLNTAEGTPSSMRTNRDLINTYSDASQAFLSRRQHEEGVRWMPLFAPVAALYGRGAWLRNGEQNSASRYTFARTVARYMDKAASAHSAGRIS